MAWSDAAHGYWCNSKTYPTTCRYCGEQVFFFTCDCGCKVFFDSLGPPWPTHNCIERVESLLGTEGLARHVRLYDDATELGPRLGRRGTLYADGHPARAAASPTPTPPRASSPAPGTTAAEVGHVREVLPGVDVFGCLGYLRIRSSLTGYSAGWPRRATPRSRCTPAISAARTVRATPALSPRTSYTVPKPRAAIWSSSRSTC